MHSHFVVFTFFVLLLFMGRTAICKEFDKEFFKKNLHTDVYPIDSEAGAVVLYESFEIEIERGSQTEKVHRVIKILKPDAFDEANVSIYFPFDNYENYVYKLSATSYNISGNDIIETKINQSDLYKKEVFRNYYEYKFSLPGIKVGSIIEYSYEKVTPVEFYLPRWNIQEKYPKLLSEYSIFYPDAYEFTSVIHVRLPAVEYPSEKDAEAGADAFCHIAGIVYKDAHTTSTRWIRKNIPALQAEPYIITLQNFAENIESRITGGMVATVKKLNGYKVTSNFKHIDNTWEKINEDLLANEYFGKKISGPNSFLNPVVESLSKANPSGELKVKAIYEYVRSNFKSHSERNLFSRDNLKKVFDKKQGSVADINLLLVAMLTRAGINAAPMILSTVGTLSPSDAFPMLNRFNYVACAVNIDSTYVLLDASDNNNTIGVLPGSCYNGYSRIISKTGTAINLAANLIKDKTVMAIKIYGLTDTGASIEIVERMGLISSANLRKYWAKNESEKKKYLDDQLHNMPTILMINDSKILNELNPDTNMIITHTGTIHFRDNNGSIFINSTLIKQFSKNPFRSAIRKLPIEFPHQTQYQYYMSISMPADWAPIDMPSSLSEDIENGAMTYKRGYNFNRDLHILTVTSALNISTTTYPTDSYSSIKEFFGKMITKEDEVLELHRTEKK